MEYNYYQRKSKTRIWVPDVGTEAPTRLVDSLHKAEFILELKSVFSLYSRVRISIFEVMSVYPIDDIKMLSREVLLHELKKVQLQERFTFMTHDFIVMWRRSAWAFYCWEVVWSLNGNAAAHR